MSSAKRFGHNAADKADIHASERINSTAELARDLGLDCSPSSFVAIDEGMLGAIARHIRQRDDFSAHQRSRWDDSKFWNTEADAEDRSQYFTIGNAINFRFWSLANGDIQPAWGWKQGEKFSGSMYLWRSLRLCLDEGKYPVLDASFLAGLTRAEFDAIFSDDHGYNPLSIAWEDRITNLRDLGTRLGEKWDGHFYNLVLATKGSLLGFVKLCGEFRAFDDRCFKLTMVNAILHIGSGIAKFDGEPLPGIDYHLLKQLLRQGVLRPQESVKRKIERRELLDPEEGQELRRVALCAFVRLCELTGISGEVIDNRWWWNRTKCRDKNPVCLDESTAPECPFYGPCERRLGLGFPIEQTRYY